MILNDEEIDQLYDTIEPSRLSYARAIESAVINKLREGVEPVAYSVTCDGDHTGNIFVRKETAESNMQSLNESWPEHTRKVVPLYLHPDPQVAELRVELLSAHCQYEEWTKERVELTRQRDELLAGDYMRENPMYSAREVRELIAAEREACAEVCRKRAKKTGETIRAANPRTSEHIMLRRDARLEEANDCATEIVDRSNA